MRLTFNSLLSTTLLSLLLSAALPVNAASINNMTPQKLNIDIKKLQKEFSRPEEIARTRDWVVSADTGWVKTTDGAYVWDYAVTVPGATSLAVRMDRIALPTDTLLTITPATGEGRVYSSGDVVEGKPLVSGFVLGDVMRLHVRALQPADVTLHIDKIYIGAANPKQANSKQAAPSQDSGRRKLLQNYACQANASNINQSRSTVGLVISNSTAAVSCTGTLVNNVNGDGTPYIVTAAHCAIINEGQSNQTTDYTQSVSAYWNAVDGSCGTPYYDSTASNPYVYDTLYTSLNVPVSNNLVNVAHLETVPNPHPTSQFCRESGYGQGTRTTPCTVGADMWLLNVSAVPSGANPYWSGVDASDPTAGDTTVGYTGGYYTAEPVVPALATVSDISFPFVFPQTWAYSSTGGLNGEEGGGASVPGAAGPATWIVDFDQQTNNGSTGQVASGSSGSALFDSNGNTRGIASYIHSTDPDTAYFRMDLAWNGNAADSTGQLKTYLDPAQTGVTVVNGREDTSRSDNLALIFGVLEDVNVPANSAVDIRYFTKNTTSCNASSVPTIAGFNGALSYTDGQVTTGQVTVPGASNLTITCVNAAGFQKSVTVKINGGQTVNTTPDAFTFTSVSGATSGSLVTSNTVTIAGINAASPISIAGGSYSINGGTFTTAAGNIQNGQTLALQVTAPASGGQTAVAQVTVGGYSTTFSVQSASVTTPSSFSFTPVNNATPGNIVISNTVTISGINAAAPISISGGSYSINGGAFTTSTGSILNGQTLALQATAPAAGQTTAAEVTVGGYSTSFSVGSPAPAPTTSGGSGSGGGSGGGGGVLNPALLLALMGLKLSRRKEQN